MPDCMNDFRRLCHMYGKITARKEELKQELKAKKILSMSASSSEISAVHEHKASYCADKTLHRLNDVMELEKELQEYEEITDCILATIQTTPYMAQRPYLWMFLVEGYSLQKLADFQEISRQSAYNHIHEAMNLMDLKGFMRIRKMALAKMSHLA